MVKHKDVKKIEIKSISICLSEFAQDRSLQLRLMEGWGLCSTRKAFVVVPYKGSTYLYLSLLFQQHRMLCENVCVSNCSTVFFGSSTQNHAESFGNLPKKSFLDPKCAILKKKFQSTGKKSIHITWKSTGIPKT